MIRIYKSSEQRNDWWSWTQIKRFTTLWWGLGYSIIISFYINFCEISRLNMWNVKMCRNWEREINHDGKC